MSTRFAFAQLDAPLIVAPMAGGPSTPQLAAAVTNAGGLGSIAGGFLSAGQLAEQIRAARALTSGPILVNLFAPQPITHAPSQLATYAKVLNGAAERYGVRVGEPLYSDHDWAAKLDVMFDLRPDVVSFTFGVPFWEECRRLKSVGIVPLATVTTFEEAQLAVASGVEALVAQGPSAGGHRGTFDPSATPPHESLDDLLSALVSRFHLPVVAAGGLATRNDVKRAVNAGAVAAQCGTAFLRADEAGTNPVHRAALSNPEFTETVLTRAFTGRYARSLHNRFIDDYGSQAPCGFPAVAGLTGPILAASVAAGDPHGTSLWAGTEFRQARTGTAADIVAALVP